MVLISYAFWFLLVLIVPRQQLVVAPSLRKDALVLLWLLSIQLIFGALMAGHKAATAAPTWPDINGNFLPPQAFKEVPLLVNFIENKITIHFVHRTLAYILFIYSIFFTVKMYRFNPESVIFNKLKLIPFLLLMIQVILGIGSVLMSPGIIPNHWGAFEWLAQLHQVTAMLIVLSLILTLYVVRRR